MIKTSIRYLSLLLLLFLSYEPQKESTYYIAFYYHSEILRVITPLKQIFLLI